MVTSPSFIIGVPNLLPQDASMGHSIATISRIERVFLIIFICFILWFFIYYIVTYF